MCQKDNNITVHKPCDERCAVDTLNELYRKMPLMGYEEQDIEELQKMVGQRKNFHFHIYPPDPLQNKYDNLLNKHNEFLNDCKNKKTIAKKIIVSEAIIIFLLIMTLLINSLL